MSEPQRVVTDGDVNYIARFADGELVTFLNDNPEPIAGLDRVRPSRTVSLRRSVDHGVRWSEPSVAFRYPEGPGFAMPTVCLVDRTERLHVFGLRFFELNWPDGPWTSQITHVWSDDRGTTWSDARSIDFGHDYTGSLNNVTVLDTGRIVLPFSYLDPERASGRFVAKCVFSDDSGATWGQSNDCAVTGGGDFVESGAIEPVVVQLNSGLIWMVIRTVSGYFWESFSNDGSVWTPPRPTRIVSANAPAGVVRLRNGDVVIAWNNRYGEPMKEHGISYARQKLHMAISHDDSQTWSVPKVIAQINDDDHIDVQTTYPYLVEAGDGTVVAVYHVIRKEEGRNWHNPIREVLRIDPAWLCQRD